LLVFQLLVEELLHLVSRFMALQNGNLQESERAFSEFVSRFLRGFFHSIRAENIDRITVTVIAPGSILTDIWGSILGPTGQWLDMPRGSMKEIKKTAYPIEKAVSEYKAAIARGDLIYSEGMLNNLLVHLWERWMPDTIASISFGMLTGFGKKDPAWKDIMTHKEVA